jgi:hypothetical protein
VFLIQEELVDQQLVWVQPFEMKFGRYVASLVEWKIRDEESLSKCGVFVGFANAFKGCEEPMYMYSTSTTNKK